MNRILITLFFIGAFFSLNAEAQTGASVGLKAGLNVSSLNGPDMNNPESRLGFHLGLMSEIPVVGNTIMLQPELQYSLQGEGDRIASSTDLHYLNIPILAKVELVNSVNLQFGPYMGFLLSARRNDMKVNKEFNSIDAGLAIGLGYNPNKFDLSLRYQFGLAKVADDDIVKRLYTSGNDYGNRVVQLSVGYFIN
jgi:hypothetical protein